MDIHRLSALQLSDAIQDLYDEAQLRVGDPADLIVVNDLQEFNVNQTYVNGRLVADHGKSLIESVACQPINQFDAREIQPADIQISADHPLKNHPVIKALDGQLITEKIEETPSIINAGGLSR